MLTYSLGTLGRLLPTVAIMRLVSHGPCVLRDEQGAEVRVTSGYILAIAAKYVRDALRSRSLVALVERDVREAAAIPHTCRLGEASGPALPANRPRVRGTLGRSVGHVAGVLNHLDVAVASPVFVTSDRDTHRLAPTSRRTSSSPADRFRDFGELWALAYSEQSGRRPRRCPRCASAGVRLPAVQPRTTTRADARAAPRRAVRARVQRLRDLDVAQLGPPAAHEALAEEIETGQSRRRPTSSSSVEQAMRDELLGRGIDAAKILVNPNGVDPDRTRPGRRWQPRCARASASRTRLVIGFIGTFGRWHGAEVLAEAFGRLLVGAAGPARPAASAADRRRRHDARGRASNLRAHGIGDARASSPGLVPQEEGPAYLAACDILASPHVPNPDGTPFFGSPTKLFEYMAMGRAIVASDLEQIGEVLEHDRTRWLVPPGDADALADGIRTAGWRRRCASASGGSAARGRGGEPHLAGAHAPYRGGAQGAVRVMLDSRYYVYKLRSTPPRVIVRKLRARVGTRLARERVRREDAARATYAPARRPARSCASSRCPTRPRPRISRRSPRSIAHRFDLLGSGWVRVRHGMACRGLGVLRYRGRLRPPTSPTSSRPQPRGDTTHPRADLARLRAHRLAPRLQVRLPLE